MSQCSGSVEDIKRVSLILDDEERPEELFGLTGLSASDKQSGESANRYVAFPCADECVSVFLSDVQYVPPGVIERWELLQAQSRHGLQDGPRELSDLDDVTSWLESVIPELHRLQQSDPASSVEEMEASAKELKVKLRQHSTD